uniref:Uncharacterized protein n=1 Tax=Caenorhabditis japonica TaxID=281687 RepID=A0A8R1IZ84_CAEJA
MILLSPAGSTDFFGEERWCNHGRVYVATGVVSMRPLGIWAASRTPNSPMNTAPEELRVELLDLLLHLGPRTDSCAVC